MSDSSSAEDSTLRLPEPGGGDRGGGGGGREFSGMSAKSKGARGCVMFAFIFASSVDLMMYKV